MLRRAIVRAARLQHAFEAAAIMERTHRRYEEEREGRAMERNVYEKPEERVLLRTADVYQTEAPDEVESYSDR